MTDDAKKRGNFAAAKEGWLKLIASHLTYRALTLQLRSCCPRT
jgi:hypothetical protein